MSKSLMSEIANMLGVAIGEEFKIRGDARTYWLDLDGLHSGWHVADEEDNAMLHDLLCGDAEIIKIPWKPKEGQTVYSFYSVGLDGVLKVVDFIWVNDIITFQALVKAGWLYKTRAEAEAALPTVAKELGVEYKL